MSRNACNGENGETGEKSPAAGDLNWKPKVAPWRLAILAKMAISSFPFPVIDRDYQKLSFFPLNGRAQALGR